jgi:multisubunit Na+/H+ antiporter MnhB subunit
MLLLISNIFLEFASFELSALLAAALFFTTVGLRDLRREESQGLLYVILGLFFLFIHGYMLWNLPEEAMPLYDVGIWQWLVKYFAPALIALYLIFGVLSLFKERVRAGLVRIFFGLTLICYLFMIGPNWPLDVQGILVLIWGGWWFRV